jgi:hypothetical protein
MTDAELRHVDSREWPHEIHPDSLRQAQTDLDAAMVADCHRLIASAIRDARRKAAKRKKAARARCGYRRKQ